MDRFKNKYRIQSARAAWHDYSGGAYFVTVCTANREHDFGEIENGEMRLSKLGIWTQKCLEEIPSHFPHVDAPLFVVMPNHIHIILIINDISNMCYRNKPIIRVETQNLASPTANDGVAGCLDNSRYMNSETQDFASLRRGCGQSGCRFGAQSRNLASVVRGFKVGVTTYAHRNHIPFGWQPRFHDHIIRNQSEMNSIANYILHNIARWDRDVLNE